MGNLTTKEEARGLSESATARPWMQATHIEEPRAIVACARRNHSLLGIDRDGMAVFDRADDAAFVVRAVNVHDDLLAVAKAARDYLATWPAGLAPTATNADHTAMREAFATLTAALAKVDG